MVGYSEVLQTMGAIVLFSLILLSANRMIQRNTYMQVEGELEQEVVALAQEIIDEARTKEFDEVSVNATAPPANIPGDFTPASSLGNDGESSRSNFDDFDDYHNWSDVITTEQGVDFNIRAEVFYVTPDTYDSTSVPTTFKKMRVFIDTSFLKDNSGDKTQYRLEFIRNYYAD